SQNNDVSSSVKSEVTIMTSATEYEAHLNELRNKQWKSSDIPFYRKNGSTDLWDFQDLHYRDTYEKVIGRRCGQNGIGRLREVGITKITEAENAVYDTRYPFHKDLKWLESQGLWRADVPKLQAEQEEYAEILRQHDVKYHWIDWGEHPMTPFGPM